jgi:hypothetical protein
MGFVLRFAPNIHADIAQRVFDGLGNLNGISLTWMPCLHQRNHNQLGSLLLLLQIDDAIISAKPSSAQSALLALSYLNQASVSVAVLQMHS